MLMDKVLEKLIQQGPDIAALIVVVVLFLRYVTTRDKQWIDSQIARDRQWIDAHNEEVKDHLRAREESRKAIEDNTAAMIDHTKATTRLVDRMDTIRAVCPVSADPALRSKLTE